VSTVSVTKERLVPSVDECDVHCDGVPLSLDAVRERLPSMERRVESAELFRLLGDPTRLAILHGLLEGGELCVCDVAEVAGVAENVVSQAMRLLRAADVVRTRRDGRRIFYRLADAHVRMLLDVSGDHVGHREAVDADRGVR
jgi:ArsR family transcriptional regulator, lead/cadmium/zinc/bismuth-responsive transcriptional repressor